jgi:hypothetical protein
LDALRAASGGRVGARHRKAVGDDASFAMPSGIFGINGRQGRPVRVLKRQFDRLAGQ